MPKFVKTDALRMFESSIETYMLALTGFNLPKISSRKISDTRYAPIMGLLGAVVELLAKGCLIQAKSRDILYRADGFYKFGSETLEELKRFIKAKDDNISFLWESVDDEDAVKGQLLDSIDKFKLLQQYRANGLHAGIGASKDVVTVVFTDVIGFIDTLSECKRLKYLLKDLPRIENPVIDRAAILEDLSRRIKASIELGEKANLLRAIYMVLPRVPESEPEWMDRMEKVSIIPKEDDLTYLLKNMSEAHGIHLYKDRGKSTKGIPVYVDPKNPSAIPILPFYLRRELTQMNDQFYSDVGVANGRMSQVGYLSLPPDDFVIDLFAIDLNEIELFPEGHETLTAQQVWPFVASALDVQGINRPYWFLVRKCNELNQLKKFISEAVSKGGAYLRNNSKFLFVGIEALINNSNIQHSDYLKKLIEVNSKADEMRAKLLSILNGSEESQYELPDGYKSDFEAFVEEKEPLGDIVVAFLSKSVLEEDQKYWIRLAFHALNRYEDRKGLVALYRDENFVAYRSEIRKLLRLVDFLESGPSFDIT